MTVKLKSQSTVHKPHEVILQLYNMNFENRFFSGLLHSEWLKFLTDVLGQHIGPSSRVKHPKESPEP